MIVFFSRKITRMRIIIIFSYFQMFFTLNFKNFVLIEQKKFKQKKIESFKKKFYHYIIFISFYTMFWVFIALHFVI